MDNLNRIINQITSLEKVLVDVEELVDYLATLRSDLEVQKRQIKSLVKILTSQNSPGKAKSV